ncbi:hypothetical protein CEXT_464711 [Caerostris extrusa]|uniref:Uncharacterized protein n=1 Tax=Caerostris extrusa TaxID=172846 RepID=A0AAV4S768_CAEEX|nr:hypothetical protein CEXT_464711 [Caerostris extrusa]
MFNKNYNVPTVMRAGNVTKEQEPRRPLSLTLQRLCHRGLSAPCPPPVNNAPLVTSAPQPSDHDDELFIPFLLRSLTTS